MKNVILWLGLVGAGADLALAQNVTFSDATKTCVACHSLISPGIVADWQRSRHAQLSPQEAIKKPELEKRISATTVPTLLAGVAVGCAECHTIEPDKHKDTYDHVGQRIHTVVSPQDCAVCHPTEAEQYGRNLMSHAHRNLNGNALYHNLADVTNGVPTFEAPKLTFRPPDPQTYEDSCLQCHGTAVEVRGIEERTTSLGKMPFPVLAGWPNQGVGRVNPDGSLGACTSCHTRHQFSIELARKPDTCSQCHTGPDVPAYKVYMVSKHGNIYASVGGTWNFAGVPWTVGKDFTTPTCAACHISLLAGQGGQAIARRTHQMNDRLSWRIFGLPYAHSHPKSPDTTTIKNQAGLPLPTELTGELAAEYLIDAAEQQSRRSAMRQVCLACHGTTWVEGHFSRFESTVQATNEMTLAATRILLAAWESGYATGPAQDDSPFNESIEKKWVEQWLFYANSTRFASAMGGADYGVFANGRWYMSKNLEDMHEWFVARYYQKTPRPGGR